MAIYLGSEKIIFTEGSKVEVESPYTKQIIEGTISGVYSNSRISKIESQVFMHCFSLTSVDFPSCTTIGANAFYSCRGLTSISFPSCTSIGVNAFAYCSNLTSISFPSCSYIGTSAFDRCYNLLSLYLLGSSIPTLANINAFVSTPISNYTTSTGGTYGSIYVLASLYNDYLIAENWSVYSARIVSV